MWTTNAMKKKKIKKISFESKLQCFLFIFGQLKRIKGASLTIQKCRVELVIKSTFIAPSLVQVCKIKRLKWEEEETDEGKKKCSKKSDKRKATKEASKELKK